MTEQKKTTPTKAERARALQAGIDVVKGERFGRPGDAALLYAAHYAQFLADGSLPPKLQTEYEADTAPLSAETEA